MSKLKKVPPNPSSPQPPMSSVSSGMVTSRTLKFAQDLSISLWPAASQAQRGGQAPARFEPAAHSSASSTAQYWAARAFSAETLLSARTVHQSELRDLVRAEEVKRAYEIALLENVHKERHASLERLVSMLLGLVAVLLVLVIYLATHYTRQSTARTPSHFTIPILSPFTSVVEHETSVVGSKTIALVLVVIAVLSYVFIRVVGLENHRCVVHLDDVLGSGSIQSVWYLKQSAEVPSDDEDAVIDPAINSRIPYNVVARRVGI
ncbi:hypothetical protein LshimejAT787_2001230 [Lyophyllum shimeji]|uniref:Uncharacterized protein n=1 Tax=Lyophyllum shimeji TaxID=47721 RepID=A0A9P3UU39_LYOSH|nr:hypothetical protein LshimejAT787_2001230 [Lyophyllum shimeji]